MIRRSLLLALPVALAACVQAPPMPYPPVPALRHEVVLAPPPMPERYVWQPGHWQWDGRAYEWVAGHWAVRPVRGEVWEHGRWVWAEGRWAWLPGHWR